MLLFLLVNFHQLFAQNASPDAYQEKVYLITDRSYYVVDETIHLKMINLKYNDEVKEPWSNVVYVDLITPDGRKMVTKKWNFNEHITSGEMIIPHHLLSGNYYLRAYTRWMRNQSAYSFLYKQIKIINPFQAELLTALGTPGDSLEYVQLHKKEIDFLKVETASDSVFTNQQLMLKISAVNSKDILDNITVSVVREGTNKENDLYLFKVSENVSTFKFIPETRGVSLSGKVVNKADSMPVPYAKVWITLLDKQAVSREMMANVDGTFHFDMGKHYGTHDLFIQASSSNLNYVPVVLIDYDYASDLMKLPFVPFQITENEKELTKALILSSQLENIFKTTAIADTASFEMEKFFYNTPDQLIKLENYIEMPTLGDYVFELLPNVSVKKMGAIQKFRIYGNYPELALYEPLVMVDLKKIENVGAVLSSSPKDYDRIEIVQEPYIRGEIIYGGMIHFISKKSSDFSIKFPEESIFFEYNLLTETSSVKTLDSFENVPKISNCLYWNPAARIDHDFSFTFDTGSEPGKYEIVIEGLDRNDQAFRFSKSMIIY